MAIKLQKRFNYTHYLELPLKLVGCWDWYPKARSEKRIILNYSYTFMIIFFLLNYTVSLSVYLYTEWTDIMAHLDKLADCLPYLASLFTVSYFTIYRSELYELMDFMNDNFKYHSARGVSNMTMQKSYKVAKLFSYMYTASSLCSATMYVALPMIIHLCTRAPIQSWFFMDVSRAPFVAVTFVNQLFTQLIMGLLLGQLGVFFASNAILLCGQLDVLCCSVRNARYSALLLCGVAHRGLAAVYHGIRHDEMHQYLYNTADVVDSKYHYDVRSDVVGANIGFDIYDSEYDKATEAALRECAKLSQTVAKYKEKFERFFSPLLAVRVVQVTLYLCTLLYAASRKLQMITVEYLMAVALDIFIYCYYGNQITIQAHRVSAAACQGAWQAAGARPRRLLLNLLLSNKRAMVVRAGRFLPMDLTTFLTIIKTSFSYYTLLANVNEH